MASVVALSFQHPWTNGTSLIIVFFLSFACSQRFIIETVFVFWQRIDYFSRSMIQLHLACVPRSILFLQNPEVHLPRFYQSSVDASSNFLWMSLVCWIELNHLSEADPAVGRRPVLPMLQMPCPALPSRCVHCSIDSTYDSVAAVLIKCVPPAQCRRVVVGAGVNHPASSLDILRKVRVVGLSIEGKLKHFHPTQFKVIA